jgi:hypothetical protein
MVYPLNRNLNPKRVITVVGLSAVEQPPDLAIKAPSSLMGLMLEGRALAHSHAASQAVFATSGT